MQNNQIFFLILAINKNSYKIFENFIGSTVKNKKEHTPVFQPSVSPEPLEPQKIYLQGEAAKSSPP